MLRLNAEILELKTKHPFIIARGTRDTYRTVMIKLIDQDGLEGWGEAAPQRYYGETAETVLAAMQVYSTALPDNVLHLEDAEAALALALAGNSSARAGLSTALHDLAGKRMGIPVHRLFGLDAGKCPISTFTIGIDTPERIKLKVGEAKEYPALKIKLGTDDDRAILTAIREVTDRELRVDANAGWTRKQAIASLPLLYEFGVTVLEQPLDPGDLDGLAMVTRHSRIPVIADESCLTAADIPGLVGRVDGINIKLAKCGSLREALRMIAVARAYHMTVMVGCMIESSIGITAAAQFTPLVDLCDLDGAALLAKDPYAGATIQGGQLRLPDGPGLGLSAR
ncbi:MAG TPA: dipeptide epimerase [Gemmatimonadales bacterium]|nr:dipeptide epimerase [Gemmatimonadales bacterium]